MLGPFCQEWLNPSNNVNVDMDIIQVLRKYTEHDCIKCQGCISIDTIKVQLNQRCQLDFGKKNVALSAQSFSVQRLFAV